ncbi:hypothetical protein EHQ74_06120 [Leptospira levettii]|nr:hypothetical protein EHQ74_06120 [Leptospira levettii]
MDWQKIALFLSFIFVQSLFAGEKSPKEVPVASLLRVGFSPKLVAIWQQKVKAPRAEFFAWKRSLKDKEAAFVSKLWKVENLSYPPPTRETKPNVHQSQNNRGNDVLNENKPKTESPAKDPFLEDHLFLGLGYQNLDVQYLPREEKNHSSFAFGGFQKGQRFSFEKRDENFFYGIHFKYNSFHITSGNRYKPIPHFYFAKDPDFYSQMDRTNSPLPQPIQSSHFFGTQNSIFGKLTDYGIYYAPGFSSYPGIYVSSPNKSYSGVWSPGENKSSFFINDTLQLQQFGKHRIQSESILNHKESVGFYYSKSEFVDSNFLVDVTVYRDSPLLYGNVSSGDIRPEIPQTLGYMRGSYRNILGGEVLSSQEGHRYESGGSGFLPIIVSQYGNVLCRYRQYNEVGNYQYQETGRAIFYEWRKDRTVFSIGWERRELGSQWEGKIAIPIQTGHLLELSAIFREGNLKTRSWFENWTYASDFNINLTDREEIIKIKYINQFLSLNVSYSEKKTSPAPILFINFQFLHLIDL